MGAPLIDIDVEGAEAAAEPAAEPEPEPAAPEPEPKAPTPTFEPVQVAPTSEPVAPIADRTSLRTGGDKISKNDGRVLATPAVRRLATEHSVDLASVPGTGKGGRVTKADLLRVVSDT